MHANQLKNQILERLSRLPAGNSGTQALTIGVEHEFFLMNAQGAPCTHEEGQAFLECLSRLPGWHIHQTIEFQGRQTLWRVSRDHPDGRYTAVKYDHHPHLFEIAFTYTQSLQELYELIAVTLDSLHAVALEVNCQVSDSSVLNVKPSDASVLSAIQDFQDLRYYRAELFKKRRQSVCQDATNYASVIAATQTHIGGTRWWENPSLVANLHLFEPALLIAGVPVDQRSDCRGFLRQRWTLFKKVFEGYPLAGYPDLSVWSISNWVDALLRSPLSGGPTEPWAGQTLIETKTLPDESIDYFFRRVRDLQIIRPKLYGTLEFRADPAQQDARAILKVAARRLGLCAYLLEKTPDITPEAFVQARLQWIEAFDAEPSERDSERLNRAARMGLEARRRNEEAFLE